MWKLNFITREQLKEEVSHVIGVYLKKQKSMNLELFNSNLIDPVKLMFDQLVLGMTYEEVIEFELGRQRDKAITNAIGYFHQNLFKYLKDCAVPKEGFDVIYRSGNETYYVEMKNKHNAMNSASKATTYKKMKEKIEENPNAVCCLVSVITKDSQNIEWSVTIDKVKQSNERIRKISIDKFYEIVTGDKKAFYHLNNELPLLISEVIKETENKSEEIDSVIEELREKHPCIRTALYMLALKSYEGYKEKSC